MAFFKERDPFSYGPVLCNIANGVHAQASVNVENAREVGNCIILKMEGAKVSDFSFKQDNSLIFAHFTGIKTVKKGWRISRL